MREKERILFDAITQVKDEYIKQAGASREKKKPFAWKKWGAAAAAVVLLLYVGIYGFSRLGGNSSVGGGWDGRNTEVPMDFMKYEGPILPLTLKEKNEAITATRLTTLDFAPQDAESGRIWRIGVTEEYTLTNHSDVEQKLTLLYPFTGSFSELSLPGIFKDGAFLQTELYPGPYTDSFDPADSDLEKLASFEGYKAMLSNGAYLEKAFEQVRELTEKVTVYEFTDMTDGGSTAVNPTLNMSFDMDYDKSIILTYGFNGGTYDPEGGHGARHFSIPREGSVGYGRTHYLIVLGEDIHNYQLQGYQDGGCDEGEEEDSVTATLKRYEAPLGEVLRTIARYHYEDMFGDAEYAGEKPVTFEMFYAEAARYFAHYGTFGPEARRQYEFGMLEDILNHLRVNQRVLYAAADITLAPNKRATVKVRLEKAPSYDFAGAGTAKDRGRVQGYDMATLLGTNLTFETMWAEILNPEGIEILRQNFGFDIENGVTKVSLDPGVEQYYLEIKKAE